MYFNPRSREGSDNTRNGCYGRSIIISIHAPAKGATDSGRKDLKYASRFQSTLPRRERPKNLPTISAQLQFQSTLPRRERQPSETETEESTEFQSTLPRRERRGSRHSLQLLVYFNPRSREGSDTFVRRYVPRIYISIHAPAKGATGSGTPQFLRILISIHAPAKGATL